jgi:rhodanese-related sulfurtransferase
VGQLLVWIVAASGFFPNGQAAARSTSARPAFEALVRDAKTRIREIDVSRLKKMQAAGEAFLLVDVREDHEWTERHAKGAVHMGRGIIDRDIESRVPDKHARIVLYCATGVRTALVADELMKMGYSNVFSLAGGLSAYRSAGLSTEP